MLSQCVYIFEGGGGYAVLRHEIYVLFTVARRSASLPGQYGGCAHAVQQVL